MENILHNYENFESNPKSKVWITGTNPRDCWINPDEKMYNIYITNQHHSRQNIDAINRIWCEYCSMYYVWKNNIKSDYVGFCHYRRIINVGRKEMLKVSKNNNIMYFSGFATDIINPTDDYTWVRRQASSFSCPPKILDDLIEYLDSQSYVSPKKLKKICNNKKFIFYAREIFYTSWESFCNMMEFLNGYFEFIKDKYNIKDITDWREHVSVHIISYYKELYSKIRSCNINNWKAMYCYQNLREFEKIFDKDEGFYQHCNCWRIYAYLTEILIGLWIASHPRVKGNILFDNFTKNIQ